MKHLPILKKKENFSSAASVVVLTLKMCSVYKQSGSVCRLIHCGYIRCFPYVQSSSHVTGLFWAVLLTGAVLIVRPLR